MNYEIVTLEEKKIAALHTRTSNTAPDMGEKIGGLWQRLYGEGIIGHIPNRADASAYGLYTEYASDANGEYTVATGAEITGAGQLEDGLAVFTIPAGRYAKFSLVTNMQSGEVANAWQAVWASDLNRAYTVDFEHYLPYEDATSAPVDIYISLAD